MPTDAWERFEVRRWMDASDVLLDQLRVVFTARTSDAVEPAIVRFFIELDAWEARVPEPELRLGMTDIVMASVFSLTEHRVMVDRAEWASIPRLHAWARRVRSHPDVIRSKCEDTEREFSRFFEVVGSALGRSVA